MGKLTMSIKERDQTRVFDRLKRREITQKIAGDLLNMSDRWVRTKFGRFLTHGDAGLIHKNRGKPSKRQLSKETGAELTNLLTNQLRGSGPTFVTVGFLV